MSKKVHAHTHTHTQTHSLSGQTQLSEMTKKNGICNHCIIKEKKDKWNEGDVFCSCYLLLLRMSSFPFTTYSSLKFLWRITSFMKHFLTLLLETVSLISKHLQCHSADCQDIFFGSLFFLMAGTPYEVSPDSPKHYVQNTTKCMNT